MLLIAGLLSVMSCSNSKENKAVNDEKAIPVSVATPGSDDARSISLAGRVEALQSANIGTRVMGYITKIYVKTGDKVEKGQLLFSINSDDILAKRSQVDASVAQAEAAFNSAQKDFDRYTVLFKQQSATSKELDNITLQYKSAKAGLDRRCPTPSRNVAGYEIEKHHAPTLPQPSRPPVRRRQIDSPAQRPARACRRHRCRPRRRL